MSERPFILCDGCGRKTLLPLPQTPRPAPPDSEQVRAIRKDTVQQFVKMLTAQAHGLEGIGERVKIVQYLLDKENDLFPVMLTLAVELDRALPSVSRAAANYGAKLEKILG